ncbi:MAG TPA: Asp23/Gls24 family envelope stress response protein [Ktedonobacterales bacterium]|nr:Asp23/Gls24 family envelope stress response protein [Ktedonobacterales bacterium]
METSLAHAQRARRAEIIHTTSAPHRGKIEVSAQAIAAVAGRATTECYGVVGIAARHPRFTTLELVTPEHYRRGIEVRFVQDHVAIEVSVVFEYGLRISEIARNLIKDVKYAVEQALGLRVVEVNVHVQGLRVS